jgi:general secretion pathway protein H
MNAWRFANSTRILQSGFSFARCTRMSGACSAIQPPRRIRGVTLLELVIVLSLMAILSVAAAPMIGKGMSTIDQRAAAQKIAAAFKSARNIAVSQRKEAAVVVNIKALTVTPADAEPISLPSGVTIDLTTIEKEKIDDDSAAIRFYPDGGSTGGRVILKKGDRALRVDVDWLTGRVKVTEEAPA